MSRVLALEWWTEDLFELVLERPSWTYHAGECSLLIHSDQVDARPYSFSSHPEQNELRFLIRALPNRPSGFSRWLATRRPGDDVGVGTPFGLFTPGRASTEVWMATGTGVAPFLSVLRGSDQQVAPVLYWGLRTANEAFVAGYLAQRCDLRLVLSRGVLPQRISPSLDGFPLGADREYFLCGNGSMVTESRRQLLEYRVDPGRIHEERFFA